MKTFEEAKAEYEQIIADCDVWSKALQEFPTSAMGLTPDDVKKSPDYIHAKQQFAICFERQRAFAGSFVKTYKKELLAERKKKYGETPFKVQNDPVE